MNIDIRLDRLTERHEALTQSVEILTHDIQELKGVLRHAVAQGERTSIEVTKLTELIRETAGGITGLTTIVRSHEQRLPNL